jgi:hypothetical protein
VDWLQRAHEAHDVHLVLVAADPKWDGVRDDGRILEILGRCQFQTARSAGALKSV